MTSRLLTMRGAGRWLGSWSRRTGSGITFKVRRLHDEVFPVLIDRPPGDDIGGGRPVPNDLDTTSLALVVMRPPPDEANHLFDAMLANCSDAGIPWVRPPPPPPGAALTRLQSYFSADLPRVDVAVVVNVLHAFYTYGRGAQLPAALAWVHRVLVTRAYCDGTRYYHADSFLFFTARFLSASRDPALHALLDAPLRAALEERRGAAGDALAYAMRVVACAELGVRDEADVRLLLPLQREDGGWEVGWVTRYGITLIPIGSRGWTTALAIKAIEMTEVLRARAGSD